MAKAIRLFAASLPMYAAMLGLGALYEFDIPVLFLPVCALAILAGNIAGVALIVVELER